MIQHVLEKLPDYVLGLCDAEAARAIDAHLGECATCTREVAELSDAFAVVGERAPEVTPPPALRARLLASAGKVNRFEWATERFAKMLRVGIDKARELLTAMDDPRSWVAGPAPGVELYYLSAGPPLQDALAGFVRFAPGTTFPFHKHVGEENVLVLQGSLVDSEDGKVLRVGDHQVKEGGTAHAITALPGPACIYAAVVIDGIESDAKL